MNSSDDDQDLVAAVLASRPASEVPANFLSRVNARIDETAGWLGLADFRAWTLGLVPAAAVVALLAVLWPGAAASAPASAPVTPTVQAQSFSPASAGDWQQDTSADALLDAALHPARGDSGVR
jgi:hypothetical protein